MVTQSPMSSILRSKPILTEFREAGSRCCVGNANLLGDLSGQRCAWVMNAVSCVQMRGSIPLFWIQDFNQRKLKPDILLQRFDPLYEATRLHFEVRPQPCMLSHCP